MIEFVMRKTATSPWREHIGSAFRDFLQRYNVQSSVPHGSRWKLLAIIALCLFGLSANADVIFRADFETGRIAEPKSNPDGFGYVTMEAPGSTEKELHVQSAITRSGSYAVECTLHIENNYSVINGGKAGDAAGSAKDKPRCNLSKWSLKFDYGKDYWFALSVFLPNNWIDDHTSNRDTLAQVHGGNGSGPPILNLEVEGSNWRIRNAWDPNNESVVEGVTSRPDLYRGPTANDKGKWTDWVYHFRLCSERGCDGHVEVWKNGQQVVDHRGPNALKWSGQGAYVSVNLYKYGWKKNPTKVPAVRTVYFDEIRIGDSNSNFAEVSPAGRTSSTVVSNPPPPAGITMTLH